MSGRSQMAAMNGKRPSPIPARLQPEPPTQHDDLIKYIYESWNLVSKELDMCHQQHNNSANYRNGASVTYYQEREPNPQLKGQRRRQWRQRSGNSFQFRNGNVSEYSPRTSSNNDRSYYQQKNYYYSHAYRRYHFNRNNRYPDETYSHNNQRED